MSSKVLRQKVEKKAREMLWRQGDLSWKLEPFQIDIVNKVRDNPSKVTVVSASRRLGKSFTLTIIAFEQCLRHPRSIVKFIQPTQKMIRVNLKPIVASIIDDCPPDLKPEFRTQDNVYVFPNGSEIQLAGTDNGSAEGLRGGDAHICIVDEAAFCSELEYVVKSILIPTTTITRGKIILASTPPKFPDHDFGKYIEQATLKNTIVVKTIFDGLEDAIRHGSTRITPEIVKGIIDEYPGGEENPDFQREYLCVSAKDQNLSIFPEFNNTTKDEIVAEWSMPVYCHKYTSMDIGFVDLTAVLFGFWDYDHGVLHIQDELIMNGAAMTLDVLAEEIQKKERSLWTDKLTREFVKPKARIADNNLIVLNELATNYSLNFSPTAKDDKEAAINNVRMALIDGKIIINPKCKVLISHLERGTWDKNRKKFARGGDGSHYDTLDALIYMYRNLDRNSSPYPKHFMKQNEANWYVGDKRQNKMSDFDEKLKGMYTMRSSLKKNNNK